jgi:hypothetical protein
LFVRGEHPIEKRLPVPLEGVGEPSNLHDVDAAAELVRRKVRHPPGALRLG